VIITRTHTTKLHRKTQKKTYPHTQRKKERRASACGFPNPNSVVELKGGRRASVFSFFFFFGETLPNFDLKNLISTYLLYKGFFIEKNGPKFTRFQRKIKSKSPYFYDKFQLIAKNIEAIRSHFYFHV
jgi:hypothetical protein